MSSTRRGAALEGLGPLVIWLVPFMFIVVGTNLSGQKWFSLYRLAQDGRTASAAVRHAHTSNHNGCEYAFTVAGHSYRGERESCGERDAGAPLNVTYLTSDPGVHTAYPPASQLLRSMALALLLPSAAAGFIAWRRRASSRGGEA